MLTPSINDLMKYIPSRYLLVNVASRRAREIAETAEAQRIPLDEKPVKLAINEIASGALIGQVKQEYDYKLPDGR